MHYCLHPTCPAPANPKGDVFCVHCGTRLRLGDRYGAVQPTGGGASSRTFLSLDLRKLTNNRCIIKAFEQDGDGEAFRYQIARIEPLSHHAQLPSLLAYFERDRYHYLVQEFIDGRSLLQELLHLGAFDEDKIWYILREILPLLSFLHQSRIIHRDIKPANLMRRQGQSDPGSLVLVDLGAAKVVTQSSLARSGTMVGSAEYIAPEQLMGQVTFASDLYSLGTTCLHLITGLSPFELFNHADGTWLWRSVSGPVSDALADILDRLVAKNLSDRYESADQALVAVNAHWQTPTIPSTIIAKPSWLPEPIPDTEPPEQRWFPSQTITAEQPLTALAIAADGAICTGDSLGQIVVWDGEQGQSIGQFSIHRQAVAAIALSPDGTFAVSSSYDKTLQCWHPQTGQVIRVLVPYGDLVTAIAFTGDGQWISACRDGTLTLWDTQGTVLHQFVGQAPIESLAVSVQVPVMVSGDAKGTVQVWNLKQRESLRQLAKHHGSVSAIALIPSIDANEPDQQFIVSGSWDMHIRWRHIHTGGLYHSLAGHLLPIRAIALSPDAQTLATGSQDSTIKLWQTQTGTLLQTLTDHTGPINALAFQPNGRLVSISQDHTMRVWQWG